MTLPPGEDGRGLLRRTVLRIVLIYALVACVFLATTELFFGVSDGANREQSFAVRLGFIALTGAALTPVLWRELRGRRVAELRLDEQTEHVAAERTRRMEMVYRVGQRLSPVYDDRNEAIARVARALTPEFYDRVHIGLVEDEPELEALAADGARLVGNLRRRPDILQLLGAQPGDVHAAALVPVSVGETLEALVVAGNRLGRPAVDDNDVEALARVGARLANTLERIGLYQEMRRSEQRLTAVVEGSPLGIIEVEPTTGYIVRANPAAAEALRSGDRDLSGTSVDTAELGVLRGFLDRVVAGEIVVNEEVPLDRGDALLSYVQVSAAPVGAGALEAVVMILADTTTRHHLEQQVQQSQRLESLGRLAGGVAHDFNNLLTVILGYTDMVRRRLPEGDTSREDLEAVQRAGEQARDITDQLLTVSKRRVVQAEAVDANEAVKSIGQVLRRLVGSDVELLIVTDEVDAVMIDRSQLEQVLLNLVVNARDAMPQGGQLTLVTERGLLPGAGEEATVIRVSDTGVGMEPETVEHCFEPFFTTRAGQGGTGLGLSTVYGVVAQAGGEITVDSALREGTTFSVHLPVAVLESEPAPEVSVEPSGSARILLVDDEADVRRLARRGLEERGYDVVELGSGPEALDWLDEGHGVDLLITDVVMPGMRGTEVARLVHERRPGLPVLFISGYAEDPELHQRDGSGSIRFLPKPFDQDELVRAVRDALEGDVDPPARSSERWRSAAQGSKR